MKIYGYFVIYYCFFNLAICFSYHLYKRYKPSYIYIYIYIWKAESSFTGFGNLVSPVQVSDSVLTGIGIGPIGPLKNMRVSVSASFLVSVHL